MDAHHTQAEIICDLLLHPSRDAFSLPDGSPAAKISNLTPQQEPMAAQHLSQVLSDLMGLKQLLQNKILQLRNPRPQQDTELLPGKSVLVEELADEDMPDASFDPITILLASACYIRNTHTEHAWSTESTSEAAEGVLAQLEASLKEQHPAGHENATGWPRRKELAASLDLLPGCITYLQRHAVQPRYVETSRISSESGPDAFTRAWGAGVLAGWIHTLDRASLAAAFNSFLPITLHYVEDVSPAIQATGLEILHHLIRSVPRDVVCFQRELLLSEAGKCLVGCQEGVWPAAIGMAVDLTRITEGADIFGKGYADIFGALLDLVQFKAHEAKSRLVWMSHTHPLVEAMGISIVAFFGRLIPLLVGWAGAIDPATRQSALEYLLAVVRVSWPRLRHHATLLRTYVEGAFTGSKLASDKERETRDLLREALQSAQATMTPVQ